MFLVFLPISLHVKAIVARIASFRSMTNIVSIILVLSFSGMQISRRLLDFEVPVNSVGINADIRTFDWHVRMSQDFKNSDLAASRGNSLDIYLT